MKGKEKEKEEEEEEEEEMDVDEMIDWIAAEMENPYEIGESLETVGAVFKENKAKIRRGTKKKLKGYRKAARGERETRHGKTIFDPTKYTGIVKEERARGKAAMAKRSLNKDRKKKKKKK